MPLHIDFIIETAARQSGEIQRVDLILKANRLDVTTSKCFICVGKDLLTVILVPLAWLIRFICLQNSGPWPSRSLLFWVTNSNA